MHWLDIVIIVLAMLAGLVGWRVGIVKFALTLVGLGAGLYLAGRYYGVLASDLSKFIESEAWRSVAAFAIILGAVLLGALIASILLRKLLDALMLGWVDRLGGFVAAALASMLVMGAMLSVITAFPILGAGARNVTGDSVLASFLVERYSDLVGSLPQDLVNGAGGR